LDGLRAIAILAVIAFHYGPSRVPGGFLGVDVFFVLSGFLITALLVQERSTTGAISLPAVYGRRARRLLPAAGVMLAFVAAYGLLFPDRPETQHVWRDIAAALFYVANWVHASAGQATGGLLDHTWSLSVEEQFYLLWPAGLFLLLRRRLSRRTIISIVAAGALAAMTWSYNLLDRSGGNQFRVGYGLDTRGAALLVGCVLGLAVGWRMIPAWLRRLAPLAPWLGLPVLAYAFVAPRYAFGNGSYYPAFVEAPILVALATALCIFGLVLAPRALPARVLSWSVAVWIGRVSYGLYLWHAVIGAIISPDNVTFGLPDPAVQLVRAVTTLVLVVLSFYLVEQPILNGWRPQSPRFEQWWATRWFGLPAPLPVATALVVAGITAIAVAAR
jgi:peptidoglycan/LPS O-acetylase OafA/YrhL